MRRGVICTKGFCNAHLRTVDRKRLLPTRAMAVHETATARHIKKQLTSLCVGTMNEPHASSLQYSSHSDSPNLP